MIAQRLRAIGQNRYMRVITGVQAYNASTKNVRAHLCTAIVFSIIMLMAGGAYGGTKGHTTGCIVARNWEVRHGHPLKYEGALISSFTGFYILLMTTAVLAGVGYIMLWLVKRHYIHLSYRNLQGKEKHISHEDLRNTLWTFTVVCVVSGMGGGLATLFGMPYFTRFITG